MAARQEPLVLTESVVTVDGVELLPEGITITKSTLSDMPASADSREGRFGDTPFFKDMLTLPDEKEYQIPLEKGAMRDRVIAAIAEVRLPVPVAREILDLRKKSAIVYHHTLATTLLTTRAMFEVNQSDEDVRKVIRANLVKDLGMARLPPELLKNKDHLTKAEYALIKRHPVTGMVLAYHYFGEGIEAMIAMRHHERRGKGYPVVAADKPNQVVDLVTTIDIFNALMSPRSFRRESFEVAAAIDELGATAQRGEIPAWGAKIVAALYRTGDIPLSEIELYSNRKGMMPKDNYYGLTSD